MTADERRGGNSDGAAAQRVDRYVVLSTLGAGGMGVVYSLTANMQRDTQAPRV